MGTLRTDQAVCERTRAELVKYLSEHQLNDGPALWKLAQALFEVLPRDEEDWKLITALLGERETLRAEARRAGAEGEMQERLL